TDVLFMSKEKIFNSRLRLLRLKNMQFHVYKNYLALEMTLRDMVKVKLERYLVSIIIRKNDYCCVPRCSFWIKRDPQVSFHIFPEQEKHQVSLVNKFGQKERIDKRNAWILKLRIGKPVSKFMKVCSLHFTEEDYFYRLSATNDDCSRRVVSTSYRLRLTFPSRARHCLTTSCNSATFLLGRNFSTAAIFGKVSVKTTLAASTSPFCNFAKSALVTATSVSIWGSFSKAVHKIIVKY
ncbi:hypothetical protein NQ318_007947, partial [Aromia moschata]